MTDWPAAMRVLGLDADDITAGLQVPLAPTMPQPMTVTADALNVRSGPGAGYECIGQLAQGALVDAWQERDGWQLVTATGWVSKTWVEADDG